MIVNECRNRVTITILRKREFREKGKDCFEMLGRKLRSEGEGGRRRGVDALIKRRHEGFYHKHG